MDTKPPGWSSVYGAAFGDTEVVQVYHLRPPYPDETTAELVRLASGATVLDAGCGTGELARRLAPHVDRVDAVDVSKPMLAAARRAAVVSGPTCAGCTARSRTPCSTRRMR